ncbi:MAG: hydrogenase maturation nickel metallochaperone HypA [Phycisphaerae bacterium]|nr:hydrogenase maturation nickel metallochaperone HypA [Phycisphaerae bacterium]
MHEHSLATELWPQLKQIADAQGLGRVRRLEMIVGMLHGASAEMLVHSFAHAFEGTNFEGAEVLITIVDPGQEYMPPNASQPATAHGWELLIVRMEEGQE